jgi:methyl-accepting chemotaxis protein
MDAVTRFIDDVARRLQLLALNGNIIAAQAGDHGRAFRVVCRELSSLADQSKDAVADVRRLSEEMGLRQPATLGVEGSEYPDEVPADHAQEP